MPRLTRLILERLMQYYRYVCTLRDGEGQHVVTSAHIADSMEIDPTQVRKDFSAIGLRGLSRVGFDANEVCRHIRTALGFDRDYEAVLVGVGHLGGALLARTGFSQYGLVMVAAFDKDKRKVGRVISGCPIKPMSAMNGFIQTRGIRLAVLTTPAEPAQKLTDRLVLNGIGAIWNFSPARLIAPQSVFVRNEHISIGLSEIAYHLKEGAGSDNGPSSGSRKK
ncbi:MAG: redox-sensing transcriptional repressor Rex [Planctomycetota bacterium]